MVKYVISVLFILLVFNNNKSYALNIFELTAIAFGTTFAYGLYFDNSLPYGQSHWFPYSEKNIYQKKLSVINKKKYSFQKEKLKIDSSADLIKYLRKTESLYLKKNLLD